ncbi:MAG: carbon starvation protein A [Bacillota bacterium]
MTTWLILLAIVIYGVSYLTYGRGLERSVVKADNSRPTPAHAMYDGVDYAPGHPLAIYGHHFASIAGAGPITGPAIAIVWGWLPALVWVWFGNVVIGAVHDYLSVMASVRSEGKSVQWIAGKVMKPRTSVVMMVFIYLTLILVVAAFMSVAGNNFVANPEVPTATFLFIVGAVIFGWLYYRMKVNFAVATIVGLALSALAMWIGYVWPWHAAFHTWIIVLIVYAVLASSLPVWLLLQPRDYLNAYILFFGLALGSIALLVAVKDVTIPAYTMWSAPAVGGVPSPFWPTIPLVIACGSLSGFHSLVASGTTSKQLDKESHGLPVGYGAMLTEGLLATLVVTSMGAFALPVLSGVSDRVVALGVSLEQLAADKVYFAQNLLKAAGPVGGALGLFTHSYGHALSDVFGLSTRLGSLFAGLWVTAFVMTTLDTATRLGRFTWQELLEPLRRSSTGAHRVLTNRWVGGAIVALLAAWLAWDGAYTKVWSAFAGANQMVAAVAMLTMAMWVLKVQKAGGYQWAVTVPGLFLWVTVFAGVLWYIWAVPVTAAIKVIFAVMAALALLLLVDFSISYREVRAGVAPGVAAGGGR